MALLHLPARKQEESNGVIRADKIKNSVAKKD